MFDQQLRPWKDRLLQPVVGALARRVSPNAISLVAFVLGLACAVTLFLGWTWAAMALWLLNRLFDGLDGLVARATGRVSDFGGYLDIMLDFLVYAAIPAALIFRSADLHLAWAGFVLMAVFYVNAASWMYLAALLEKKGRAEGGQTSIVMPTGLVEGAETVVLYTLLIVFPQWTLVLFLGGAALTFVGAAIRFGWAAVSLNRTNLAQTTLVR